MKAIMRSILVLAVLVALSATALAHQPRIPQGDSILVPDPEVSKAYYGKLDGRPQTYIIRSSRPFALYVNILVPDIPGQQKDVSAVIARNDPAEKVMVFLDGGAFKWTRFFEPFGHDTYWMGPEYKAQVAPGEYRVIVSSARNDSKYSLAIGELERFDYIETVNALRLIPRIKRGWFNESPVNFILSPFGWGLALLMFALAFGVGFLLRFLLARSSSSVACRAGPNLGIVGRLVVAAIGIALFAWAITTTWSPLLLFCAGFACFAATAGWCGLCAVFRFNNSTATKQ
jgi:hypothetical protein